MNLETRQLVWFCRPCEGNTLLETSNRERSRTPTPPGVSERRRRKSSGNSMLEVLLTLVPTFALIFAFMDFGMMIFRWTTLQNAVREGCRYAITFQTATGLGQDASIEQVVSQYAFNIVTAADSPQHIFVKYYSPTTLAQITTGGNVPGNIVQVSVQNVSFSWMAPISGNMWGWANTLYTSTPLALQVYSEDILGGYPVGVTSVTE
jgi:Flp pilus assembly protein TadG